MAEQENENTEDEERKGQANIVTLLLLKIKSPNK